MNVFVFDSQPETSQLWQELATAHGFRVNVFHSFERVAGLASEAHILVIDQSVVPLNFQPNVSAICRQHPRVQVIATGNSLRIDEVVDLMKGGAELVFSKPLSRSRILSLIPELIQQVEKLTELVDEYERLQERFSKLTSREKDVLNYILIGTSNKDTAQLLNVSVRTIESRRAKVYRKLGANNVAELVRKVDRLGSLGKELGDSPQPKDKALPSSTRKPMGSNIHPPLTSPHRLPQSVAASGFARA